MANSYHAIVFMQPRRGKPVTLFVPEINLELMQGLVIGNIERVPDYGNIAKLGKARVDVWCNEEGKLLGMQPNFLIGSPKLHGGDLICGPVMLCSNNDDGESVGLTGEQHKIALEVLSGLQRG